MTQGTGVVRGALSLALDRVTGEDLDVKEEQRRQIKAMIGRMDAMIRGDESAKPTVAELREVLPAWAEDNRRMREVLASWDGENNKA